MFRACDKINKRENRKKSNAVIKWSPRDRRRTVEGSSKGRLGCVLKIRKLLLYMDGWCNALIFRWCVVAAKKARRTHIEGRKNA